MNDAGLTLVQSLRTLEEHGTDPRLRLFCKGCRRSLESGTNFPDALKINGLDKITSYQLGVIRLADGSGSLGAGLKKLADEEEESWRMFQRICAALIYPVSVFVLVSFSLVLFLPLVVFPQYLSLIDGLHLPEEGLFRWVLWFMRLTQGYLFFFLVGALLLFSVAFLLSASVRRTALWSFVLFGVRFNKKRIAAIQKDGGLERFMVSFFEAFTLRYIPAIGKMLQAAYTARFSRSLGVALNAGMSLNLAIPLVTEAVGSSLVARSSSKIVGAIEGGSTLAQSLEASEAFPAIFLQMVTVGEESGKLGVMLEKSSVFYGELLESFCQDTISYIEPVLTGLLGLVVGGLVLISMYPILIVIQSL